MDKYICIHGHFYQPPRENPWVEEIEFQDSAYPYHDWNERITAECYAPNAASRILDSEGKIIDIINLYSKISFDFGPTLLSWLERHQPDVHEAIIEADRLSIERFSGHGSAIAHGYNHIILPLANRRDKYTQILWGIKDFEKRFKRAPEGMWLPETAVDTETLEVLVTHGIKFTVLAQRQAKKIKNTPTAKRWRDVSGERVDPTMAYKCNLPSGRSISLFFYDGPISQDISFGGLLKNGETFANRLLSAFNDQRTWPQLVHMATDGETFGHHHRHGEMALSYALHHIKSNNLAKLTNYSEYLEKHPPTQLVEIFDNSSWSCVHGVERWRDNCGCSSGMNQGWTQTWRKPLRNALDWLRDSLDPIFWNTASKYLKSPWDARDDYIEVLLNRSYENIDIFLEKHSLRELTKEEKIICLKLLEIQRNAMLMYTSCGWFFDEVSGIETVQIMQYASKAIQYAEEFHDTPLEPEFINHLRETPSNIFESAAEPYEKYVKSAKTDLIRVGAHFCISSIFEDYPEDAKVYCYTIKSDLYDKAEAGRLKLVIGKSDIRSDITWDGKTISFAVLHLGDHNINAGVKDFQDDESFSIMQNELTESFQKGNLPEVVRLMDRHFENIYSLWHLFKDEQRKILDQILQLTYDGVESSYRHIYEDNFAIMSYYHSLQQRLPRPFHSAAEYMLNTDLKKFFDTAETDVDKLKRLIEESQRWGINLDRTTISFNAGTWVNSIMEQFIQQPEDIQLLTMIDNALEAISPLNLTLDLWKAQNIYFSISRRLITTMKQKTEKGEEAAQEWLEGFFKLGAHLYVNI